MSDEKKSKAGRWVASALIAAGLVADGAAPEKPAPSFEERVPKQPLVADERKNRPEDYELGR